MENKIQADSLSQISTETLSIIDLITSGGTGGIL